MLEAQAAAASGDGEDAAEQVDGPWWLDLLPEGRINLGLDLQGGIDMTLQVEVDEAVVSAVHRDVAPLKTLADDDGLRLADVRRARGEPVLLLRGEAEVPSDEVRRFMTKRFDTYEFLETRTLDGDEYLAFGVLPAQSKYSGDRAIEQALETLRSRIDETGVKEPSIVLKGGNRINVQLPGLRTLKRRSLPLAQRQSWSSCSSMKRPTRLRSTGALGCGNQAHEGAVRRRHLPERLARTPGTHRR